MKKRMLTILCCCYPLLGLAESVDSFHIGTPEHPTINGSFISSTHAVTTESHSEKKTLGVSIIPPILLPPKQSENSTWSEEHVASVLEKAAKGGKLSYVLDAAKRYHLPAHVALIPIVESRYQTTAVSPKGAAGIWQLSRAVVSDFGSTSASRFDWKASTEIALQHLSNLYTHYGRWDLTWAAYNAGQGRVDAALRKNPEAIEADALILPIETRDYVKQLTTLNRTLSTMGIHHV